MKILIRTLLSIAIGGALFLFWYSEESISAASTGYNATERGLFGWVESYSFGEPNEMGEYIQYERGERFRPRWLAAEIVLWLVVGALIANVGGWAVNAFLSASGQTEEEEF